MRVAARYHPPSSPLTFSLIGIEAGAWSKWAKGLRLEAVSLIPSTMPGRLRSIDHLPRICREWTVACPENGVGSLDVVVCLSTRCICLLLLLQYLISWELFIFFMKLARSPLFFKDTDPQPRKHTLWQATSDFTHGQASMNRWWIVQCSHFLARVKLCSRLLEASLNLYNMFYTYHGFCLTWILFIYLSLPL
jgi:hypothetical protein